MTDHDEWNRAATTRAMRAALGPGWTLVGCIAVAASLTGLWLIWMVLR